MQTQNWNWFTLFRRKSLNETSITTLSREINLLVMLKNFSHEVRESDAFVIVIVFIYRSRRYHLKMADVVVIFFLHSVCFVAIYINTVWVVGNALEKYWSISTYTLVTGYVSISQYFKRFEGDRLRRYTHICTCLLFGGSFHCRTAQWLDLKENLCRCLLFNFLVMEFPCNEWINI